MVTMESVRRMGALVCAAAVLAAVCSPAARAEIERPKAFQKRVADAIDRGARAILGQRATGGGWAGMGRPAGMTALCYHALSVAGIPQDDPDMRRAYARMEELHDGARASKSLSTYGVGLMLMAIEDHMTRGSPTSEELAADRAWMKALVERLEQAQSTSGGWSYGEARMSHYDLSNTQYALLGLKAASRAGIEVEPRTFRRALRLLIRNQERDGPKVVRRSRRYLPRKKGETREAAKIAKDRARGWNYQDASHGKQGAYGSMTAGGVSSVVICRSELLGTPGYGPEADGNAERAARDGLAWLGKHFDVRKNPPRAGPNYYYLYGLERAGMLANVDHMGSHDWYGEGVEYLLGVQSKDGSWRAKSGEVPLVQTCFAVLFLARGTTQVKKGSITPVTGERSINFDVAQDLNADDFDDFIDLVLSRYRRTKDEDAQAHILIGVTEVGPRIVLPLLRRMDANDETRRRTAYTVLRHATGLDLPYDPAATGEERAQALTAWEAWFLRNAKRLSYDADSGRLVVGK